MSKDISLDEILAKNPQIDKQKLIEANELNRKLRESGTLKQEYNLASPYYKRQDNSYGQNKNDSRTVYLRSSR